MVSCGLEILSVPQMMNKLTEYLMNARFVLLYRWATLVRTVGTFFFAARTAKYCIKCAVVSQIVTCLITSQYKYLTVFTFDR